MELKSSDLAELFNKNVLDAAVLQVSFVQENIMDLLMVRDLTENARFELQNISSDRRSLREQQSFYLNELAFDTPYEFRIFNLNDVLQLRIRDVGETFASLKLAEMPLRI